MRGVWEINGIIIPANSWVYQFWQLWFIQMANESRSVTKSSGVAVGISPHANNFSCVTSENVTGYGIMIGSSNQPVDIMNDYALISPYSTSEFYHSSCTVAISGNDDYIEVYRSFQNISGTSKDIYELGLFCAVTTTRPGACIERTVLGTPITVADGQDIPIRFKIYFTP